MSVVAVPPARLERWVANFDARHGSGPLAVEGGRLVGVARDGSRFAASLPFGTSYDGTADAASFAAAAVAPACWGVLLVRKGGFAVALLEQDRMAASKVGQRHVQGRTKAGGQSQQRFARRRDNQAREAYAAAAGHAARILTGPLAHVVTGGDHAAVEAVLADPRLRHLADRVGEPWLAVPDPRRAVLEEAVAEAMALRVDVVNA